MSIRRCEVGKIPEGFIKSSVRSLTKGMTWIVKRTNTFLSSIKPIQKNKQALDELDKKIKRLQEDPLHVGGWLSGELHGKKSTRITKKYRLIFTPNKREKVVYLNWVDHREHAY